MGGVGHGGRKSIPSDQNEKMAALVDLGSSANRLNQAFESFLVVASTVLPKVDHQLVGVLVIYHVQKAGGVFGQLAVATEVAIDRMRLGQTRVPKGVFRFLPK